MGAGLSRHARSVRTLGPPTPASAGTAGGPHALSRWPRARRPQREICVWKGARLGGPGGAGEEKVQRERHKKGWKAPGALAAVAAPSPLPTLFSTHPPLPQSRLQRRSAAGPSPPEGQGGRPAPEPRRGSGRRRRTPVPPAAGAARVLPRPGSASRCARGPPRVPGGRGVPLGSAPLPEARPLLPSSLLPVGRRPAVRPSPPRRAMATGEGAKGTRASLSGLGGGGSSGPSRSGEERGELCRPAKYPALGRTVPWRRRGGSQGRASGCSGSA